MQLLLIAGLFFLILTLIVLLLPCYSKPDKIPDLPVVFDVDIEKYMGKWYEIARFPHRFEKDLVGVTATYTLLSNGNISVLNQGYKHQIDGKLSKAKGKARIPFPETP